MIGENKYLEELNLTQIVMFLSVMEQKEESRAICKLVSLDFHYLEDVLLLEGLTTNLIIISQLCVQSLNVKFNQFKCIVISKEKEFLYLYISSLILFDIQC